MAAFDDDRFPTDISYGSSGGPGFMTDIHKMDSGDEERISRWSQALRVFDVAERVKTRNAAATLITFFRARGGAAREFPFKDHLDFTSAVNGRDAPTNVDQVIGVGDGTKTQFQLVKKWTSGPSSQTENIILPVTGTVLGALDTVDQAGNFTVNRLTGIVTYTTPPTTDVEVTAGFEYDVRSRFGKEADKALQVLHEDFDATGLSIPIVQVKDGLAVAEDFPFGNGQDRGVFGAVTVDALPGLRVQRFEFTSSGGKVRLPPLVALTEEGGAHFHILNNSTSIQFDIIDNNDAAIANNQVGTLNGKIVDVVNASGTKSWVIIL